MLRSRSRRLANRLLHELEVHTASSSLAKPLPYAPLFLVGAPRSGSTLLFQLVTEVFDVGYVANAHCSWYGAPSLLERIRRPLRDRSASDFSSDYGATGAPAGPSECGELWYRFFPRHPHAATSMPPRRARQLRAHTRALVAAFGRPVVHKNLYCTLRLRPIAAALPEALFVEIRRDLVDNAHSLLEGRRRNTGGFDAWWSAEPPNVEELRALPAHEQVVEQVRAIDEVVARDAAAIGTDRFHSIDYEALCADPAAVLDGIAAFAAAHGVELRRRAPAPQPFARSASVRIPEELYGQLATYARSTVRVPSPAPDGVTTDV